MAGQGEGRPLLSEILSKFEGERPEKDQAYLDLGVVVPVIRYVLATAPPRAFRFSLSLRRRVHLVMHLGSATT